MSITLMLSATVQLVQQLQHGPLNLPVSRLLDVEPLGADSIQFVDEGAFSLASANVSLTSLAPSPMNIWTSWGPASLMKVDLACAVQHCCLSIRLAAGSSADSASAASGHLT